MKITNGLILITLLIFSNSLFAQSKNSSEVISEERIESFYNQNKPAFRKPEARRVREIVVAKEVQARQVLIDLLKGVDFSTLAKNYSIAKSGPRGGDLGYINAIDDYTMLIGFDKFFESVFTLEEGSVSTYFPGPDGFYIVKVEEIKKPDGYLPLSEVREFIIEYLSSPHDKQNSGPFPLYKLDYNK